MKANKFFLEFILILFFIYCDHFLKLCLAILPDKLLLAPIDGIYYPHLSHDLSEKQPKNAKTLLPQTTLNNSTAQERMFPFIRIHLRLSQFSLQSAESVFTDFFHEEEHCHGHYCTLKNQLLCFDHDHHDCKEMIGIRFHPNVETIFIYFTNSTMKYRKSSSSASPPPPLPPSSSRANIQAVNLGNVYENLCDMENAVKGKWIFRKQLTPPVESQINNLCPKSKLYYHNFTTYSCPSQIYNTAHFQPLNNCSVLPLQVSLQYYYKHNLATFSSTSLNSSVNHHRLVPKMMVVGDSLINQLMENIHCDIEHILDYDAYADITEVWERYLRADWPCPDYCRNSSHTFSTRYPKQLACNGCSFQSFFDPTNISATSNQIIFQWIYKIPEETEIVIVDTGAWFSPSYGVEGNQLFKQTIQFMKPHLQAFLQQPNRKKLRMYWLGLPPMTNNPPQFAYYSYFPMRNNLIKELITSVGHHDQLLYFDVESFTKERKLKDSQINRDDLHWCEPGYFSIPSMMFEIIMHLFIRDRLLSKD